MSNALQSAYEWTDKVIVRNDSGEPVGFRDAAARMPAARAAFEQAVRPKLRAESGATITADEVDGEQSRYVGGLFSSDTTNVGKAENLVSDLENQLRAFGPAGEAEIQRIRQARQSPPPQTPQPPANMGGQGPTRNLQNPPPAAGGWSVRQL